MEVRTIETYNAIAQGYDEQTAGFWDKFPSIMITQFQQRVVGRVLDIGSGPGRDGVILRNHGLKVVCLDAAREMVSMTGEKGLESVQADFQSLPFADQSFNGVWAYTSLIHDRKENLPHALQEIKRVLKHWGVFGLGIIEGNSEGYKCDERGYERWFAYYQWEEIKEMLTTAGFDTLYFGKFIAGKTTPKTYLNILARRE